MATMESQRSVWLLLLESCHRPIVDRRKLPCPDSTATQQLLKIPRVHNYLPQEILVIKHGYSTGIYNQERDDIGETTTNNIIFCDFIQIHCRWRLVIHGGIDGYSRLVTFLGCSGNNRASTVLKQFKTGLRQFGLPEKVRSDKGAENADVATFMLEKRGVNDGAFITGRSVHNQRIERLWKDLRTVNMQKYDSL